MYPLNTIPADIRPGRPGCAGSPGTEALPATGVQRDTASGGKGGQVTSSQDPDGNGVPFDTSRAHMARVYDEVRQFFTGLELVEPGVVQVHRWRHAAGDQDLDRNLAIYAGVGRKP